MNKEIDTMLPIKKVTREKLRKLRITKHESYDEVINRLIKLRIDASNKENGEGAKP